MRSEYFKGLDSQEAYNITDGLSVTLHEISIKRLGLNWNTMPTDDSNEIYEICSDVIDEMHEQLDEKLKDWESSKPSYKTESGKREKKNGD